MFQPIYLKGEDSTTPVIQVRTFNFEGQAAFDSHLMITKLKYQALLGS